MSPVALGGGAPVAQPVHNLPGDVGDGDAHHQQDGGHPSASHDAQASQGVAQEEGAVAAHKDAGGVEVVGEKTQGGAQQGNGEQGHAGLSHSMHVDRQDDAQNRRHPRRQPVQPVQPVDGVDHPRDPEEGQHNHHRHGEDDHLICQGVVHPLNEDKGGDGDGSGHQLGQQLAPGREVPAVVGQAHQKHPDTPQDQPQQPSGLVGVRGGDLQRQPDRQRQQKGEKDAQSAGAGDDSPMEPTPPRRGRHPPPVPQTGRQGGEDQGRKDSSSENQQVGHADCRLRIADCGLQIADCRLQIADCRLRIADCRFSPALESPGGPPRRGY